MNYLKYSSLALVFLIVFSSCGRLPKPTEAVHLYNNQLSLLNGYYEIEPYESYYSLDGFSLEKVFDMKIPLQVKYIELEFLDEKTLQISYEYAGNTHTKKIKGKHKNGGFYLEKSWGAFGIPPILWHEWNNGKCLYMGNDDNLIYSENKNQYTILFGLTGRTNEQEVIFYDRLYEKFYTGKPKKIID